MTGEKENIGEERIENHMTIDSFRGPYAFLSNFKEANIYIFDSMFRNAEAAYQSQKCPERAYRFVGLSAAEAKTLGKTVPIRKNWDEIKVNVMRTVLLAKFRQNRRLAKQLLDTKDSLLIEGNTWHDTYWGVCNGIGKNMLGELLMEVRAIIQKEEET